MVYIISPSVGAPSETASAIFLSVRALPFDPYAQPFILCEHAVKKTRQRI